MKVDSLLNYTGTHEQAPEARLILVLAKTPQLPNFSRSQKLVILRTSDKDVRRTSTSTILEPVAQALLPVLLVSPSLKL
jgi:hypothetical protein